LKLPFETFTKTFWCSKWSLKALPSGWAMEFVFHTILVYAGPKHIRIISLGFLPSFSPSRRMAAHTCTHALRFGLLPSFSKDLNQATFPRPSHRLPNDLPPQPSDQTQEPTPAVPPWLYGYRLLAACSHSDFAASLS